jgi:hypothetical protein
VCLQFTSAAALFAESQSLLTNYLTSKVKRGLSCTSTWDWRCSCLEPIAPAPRVPVGALGAAQLRWGHVQLQLHAPCQLEVTGTFTPAGPWPEGPNNRQGRVSTNIEVSHAPAPFRSSKVRASAGALPSRLPQGLRSQPAAGGLSPDGEIPKSQVPMSQPEPRPPGGRPPHSGTRWQAGSLQGQPEVGPHLEQSPGQTRSGPMILNEAQATKGACQRTHLPSEPCLTARMGARRSCADAPPASTEVPVVTLATCPLKLASALLHRRWRPVGQARRPSRSRIRPALLRERPQHDDLHALSAPAVSAKRLLQCFGGPKRTRSLDLASHGLHCRSTNNGPGPSPY